MSEFRGRDTESVNITLASGRFFRHVERGHSI